MKRVLLSLLILSLLFGGFSCKEKNRSYDEEEVLSAARDLLPKAQTLDRIYYGEGLRWNPDESGANGSYYPADEYDLAKYGFSTVDELKKFTRGVFSEGYSSLIFNTKLSSVADEDGIHEMARYYQKTENGEPVSIMVYTRATVIFTSSLVLDMKSMAVEGSVGQKVYVTLPVYVTDESGEHTQTRTLRFPLFEEQDGWRIDGATFINYYENHDGPKK